MVIRFCTLLILFCLAFFSLEAQLYPDEKEVSVTLVDVSIDSALLILSSESSVNITYDARIIPSDKLVTLAVKNFKLGLALDAIFESTSLAYQIVGRNIVIIRENEDPVKEKARLSGYVIDGNAGERLVYANIYITDTYTGEVRFGNVTNDYGYYSIFIPVGIYQVNYSFLGYTKKLVEVDLRKDTLVNVTLQPENLMNEIVIRSELPANTTVAEQSDQIPIDLLQGMSNLGGEPDLYRMMQMRAGVTSFTDGFGGIQVRGGQSDHTLVSFDGVPVYSAGHALGLFSIFNSSVIKSANLIKAGIPARYGGRLSAVLDVRAKDGNNNNIAGDFAISPLLAKGTIELPIVRGKSSLLISGRRSIIDPWLKPLSKYQFERNNEEGFINFYFYDFNAKFNAQIGKNDNIYLSYYKGEDRYDNDIKGEIDQSDTKIEELDNTQFNWGNELASFRWTHLFGNRAFFNATAHSSRFNFSNFEFSRTIFNPDTNPLLGFSTELYQSNVRDLGVNLDIDLYISQAWKVRLGLQGVQHSVSPGGNFASNDLNLLNSEQRVTRSDVLSVIAFPELVGHEYRGYIENEFKLGSRFIFSAGVHAALLRADGVTYRFLEPRGGLSYQIGENTFFKLGYTEMDQFMHVVSTFGLGLPTDIWIPSTGKIDPQRSFDWSLSYETMWGRGYRFKLGGFTKRLMRLRSFIEGGIFSVKIGENWEDRLLVGNGASRGIEVEVEKVYGGLRGFVSYTYAKSTRTFEDFNEGNTFYANNDRRHQVSLNIQAEIYKNLEFNVGYTYNTGNPLTLPVAIQPVIIGNNIDVIPVYGDVNNARFPAYHKLDVGINIYNQYSWARQKISLGVYNLYNRRNPFYVDLVKDENRVNSFKTESVSLLPMLPYLSFGLSF